MVNRIRSHFAHNVVGYIALTVALSGTAYAAGFTGADIKDGTITGADIKNNTIRGVDVRKEAVQRSNIKTAVLPSIRVTPFDPGEHAVAPSLTELGAVTLDGPNQRYLVIANFATTGDVGPFDCELGTETDKELLHVTAPGSQTMVLAVSTPTEGAVAARLKCALSTAKRTNLVHPTLTALRVSTE